MQPVAAARKKKLTRPEVESLINELLLPDHATFDALLSFSELINGGPFKQPPKAKAKSLTVACFPRAFCERVTLRVIDA